MYMHVQLYSSNVVTHTISQNYSRATGFNPPSYDPKEILIIGEGHHEQN
jgi:hypothetical protein